MRERERLELKKFQEEEEKRIREPIERHARELARTAGELLKVQRSNVLDIPDPDFYISPDLMNVTMSIEEARLFNAASAKEFLTETPGYFASQSNFTLLANYFDLNGCGIISADMFQAAYRKLDALGLLEKPAKPEPKSEPEPSPEPELQRLPLWHQTPIAHRVEHQGSATGRDLETGEYRQFTEHEMSKLSADDFRKVFGLNSIDNMQFPIR